MLVACDSIARSRPTDISQAGRGWAVVLEQQHDPLVFVKARLAVEHIARSAAARAAAPIFENQQRLGVRLGGHAPVFVPVLNPLPVPSPHQLPPAASVVLFHLVG